MEIIGNTLDYAHISERHVTEALRRIDPENIKHIFSFALINRNLSNTDHEADLILVGRAGVYLVEIKSGPIKVVDGQYYRGDTPLKSPILQAKQAWYDLQEVFMTKKIPVSSLRYGGYAALYVDVSWGGGDKDADMLIMDKSFFSDPVKSLENIVHNRFETASKNRWRTKAYSVHEIAAIRNILNSNSSYIPDIRVAIDAAKGIYVTLGEDQARIYEGISRNNQIRIIGPPGSGKTVLAYQILRDNYKKNVKTIYVCKNRALAKMLEARFRHEHGFQPTITIKTIDGLVHSILDEASLPKMLHIEDNFTTRAIRAKDAVLKGLAKSHTYDTVIIDEAQDVISSEYCDLIDAVLIKGISNGCWRVFLDPQQDLFATYDKDAFDLYFTGEGSFEYQLHRNYRNTVEIQIAAKAMSGHDYEITRNFNPVGIPPEICVYPDGNQTVQAKETGRVINSLLQKGVKPSEITILSFVSRNDSLAGSGILKIRDGIKLEHISAYDWDDEDNRSIIYASVYEYKGLDNETIVYTDIDKLGVDATSKIAHFVGATRAKSYYIMIMSSSVAKQLISSPVDTELAVLGRHIHLDGTDPLMNHSGLTQLIDSNKSDIEDAQVDNIVNKDCLAITNEIKELLRLRPLSREEIANALGLDIRTVTRCISLDRNHSITQGKDLKWSLRNNTIMH